MNRHQAFFLPLLLALTACGGTVNPRDGSSDPDGSDPSSSSDGPMLGSPNDGGPPSSEPDLDWQMIQPCPDSGADDAIEVSDVKISGSTIEILAEHGGGCGTHRYGLCYSDAWAESYPVQIGLKLLHEASGDDCDALVQVPLTFDLTPLEEAYDKAYRTNGDRVSLSLGNFDLLHTFGTYRTEIASWDEIGTEIDRLNTCEVVADCQRINTSPCKSAYVNKDADVAALSTMIEDRNALDSGGVEYGCDTACECGLLLCEGGQCITEKDLGCESATDPGTQSVCL